MELYGTKLVHRKPDKLGIYCVACDDIHFIPVHSRRIPGYWAFNGAKIRPTFAPGVRLIWGDETGPGAARFVEPQICHFYIMLGVIRYLSRCTHDYAGLSFDLPDIPQHIIEAYEIGAKPRPRKPAKIVKSALRGRETIL